MWGWIALLFEIMIFVWFMFMAMEMAGGAGDPPSTGKASSIKGRYHLKAENPDLPEEILDIFEAGASYQRAGDNAAACRAYCQLRELRLSNGETYDLLEHSAVFHHNWDLLPLVIRLFKK